MATKLNLLGPFELIMPNDKPLRISSKNGKILLAMLALEKDKRLSRDKIIGALWATRSEQQARNSLRQTLSSLRKIFKNRGLNFLKTNYTHIQLAEEHIEVDVWHIPDSFQGQTLNELKSIKSLFQDQFLAGLFTKDKELQDWLDAKRRHFNSKKLKLLLQIAKHYYDSADFENVIRTGNQLLASDPLNEQIHRIMIKAFSAKGDRVSALKQYQNCSKLLEAELSISPSQKTNDVYADATKIASNKPVPKRRCKQAELQCRFSEKPTITILPFKNITKNKRQQSLCDGLTEDITTHLSRFRDLQVIASSSSLTCQNSDLSKPEMPANLNAEYSLEGSVQKIENRLKISTRLIESNNAVLLWSEIYDRGPDQINNLQDDVAEMIVGTLASVYGGRLRKAWQKQKAQPQPAKDRAFDFFMKAIDYANAFTMEKNKQARLYFKKATEIDPEYAKAYSGIACTYLLDAVESWEEDYDSCMQNCLHYATRAIDCDDNESWSYWQLAVYLIYTMNHELALLKFEKAIALNPNDADVLADAGYYFSYCGHSEKALEHAFKAMRLNPHYPDYYLLQLGQILFDARDYKQAISMFKKSHRTNTALASLYLAASHAALGQTNRSTRAINQALALDKNASVKKWTDQRLSPYRYARDLNHFRLHLESAGLH